jgi:hypothetical protein
MERPDLSKVTRIQTAGGWIEIKEGSLNGASGVMYTVNGTVQPLYSYMSPGGQRGAVRAAEVIAFEPFETVGQDPRPEYMGEFSGAPALNDKTPAWLNRP